MTHNTDDTVLLHFTSKQYFMFQQEAKNIASNYCFSLRAQFQLIKSGLSQPLIKDLRQIAWCWFDINRMRCYPRYINIITVSKLYIQQVMMNYTRNYPAN